MTKYVKRKKLLYDRLPGHHCGPSGKRSFVMLFWAGTLSFFSGQNSAWSCTKSTLDLHMVSSGNQVRNLFRFSEKDLQASFLLLFWEGTSALLILPTLTPEGATS